MHSCLLPSMLLLIHASFVCVAPFYRENPCIPRASGMMAVMFMSMWKELWYDKKYGEKVKNSWVGLFGGMIGAAFTFIL